MKPKRYLLRRALEIYTKRFSTFLTGIFLSAPLFFSSTAPVYADAVVQGAVYQNLDYTTPATSQYLYGSPINFGSPADNTTVSWNYLCDAATCPGYVFSATGAAKVNNGSLGAQSTILVNNAPAGQPNYLAEADSYAQYTDALTITGGTGNGVLQLQYTVDGSASGTGIYGGGYAYVGLFGASGVYSQLNNGAISNSSLAYITSPGANQTDTVTFYVPFTYGTQLSIEPILKTTAQYLGYEPTPFASNWDFYNTATLDSALILDGTADNPGNQISNAMIAATSGLTYTPTGISTVPLPAAAWLFGSGLLGLIGVARRKKV
jgi:hypothetical protein